MILYTYDGSFEGLLSVFFEIYLRGRMPLNILPAHEGHQNLLAETVHIETSMPAAQRVLRGLIRGGTIGKNDLRLALVSHEPGIERLLFYHAIGQFGLPRAAESARSDRLMQEAARSADQIERLARQVRREIHRMHAFVRFELQPDGVYAAEIEPQFDVLDLLAEHFIARYPAQRWLIRDVARARTLVYEGQARRDGAHEDETEIQTLWQTYFRATNIPVRQNLALQRRHVPLHYRKYLTEMRPLK